MEDLIVLPASVQGSAIEARLQRLYPSLPTRAYLMKVLKQFDIGFISPVVLARRLKELIHDPEHLELFDLVRPLVPLRDQLQYSAALPEFDLKKIYRLQLTRTFLQEDFGFKICGGTDQNCAVFVNWVEKKSKAWRAGLRRGQQIVRINQLSVAKSTHHMIVDYFKISHFLQLEVKNMGMVPRSTRNLGLGWAFVDKEIGHYSAALDHDRELAVLFRKLSSSMIGAHVRATEKGIMIASVKQYSDAEEAQLRPGDVIVEVNGNRLDERDFEECLAALSSEAPFLMKITREERHVVFE